MKKTYKFVFFGSDKIADEALTCLADVDLVPDYIVHGKIDDEVKARIKDSRYEFAILASYGRIVKEDVIALFPKGILNIHPSLLPLLRGPSPIKSAILENMRTTGTSIMLLVKEMDAGPILIQEEIDLSPQVAYEQELRIALFKKGAELITRILPDYLSGKLKPTEQDHRQATYTKKFTSEDTYLPYSTWRQGLQVSEELERKVRALYDEPGTYSIIPTQRGEKRIKILKAHIENSVFVPDLVQPEGKNPMSWSAFLLGNPLK